MATTYKQATLTRAYDKAGNLLGYSAQPEQAYQYGDLGLPKTWYQITCDEATGKWNCTCAATKPCKHIKAAQELNEIRLGVTKVEEVAPVAPAEERKPRSFKFEAPTDVIAMKALVAISHKTTSQAKRGALCNLFSSMADEQGKITIHADQWYYDADLRSIYEVVVVPEGAPKVPVTCQELVARMSPECLDPALSPEEQTELMHALAPWDAKSGQLDSDPFADPIEAALNANDSALYEDDEEEEFSEEKAVQWAEQAIAEATAPTKAQVIMRVRECAMDLVSVCDGAREDDSAGCNGVDAKFMHRMMGCELWRPEQVLRVAEKLQKYNRTQLGGRVPSVAVVQKVLGLAPKSRVETGLAARSLMR